MFRTNGTAILLLLLLVATSPLAYGQEESSDTPESVTAATKLREQETPDVPIRVWQGRAVKTRGSQTIFYVPPESRTRYEILQCVTCGIDFCQDFEIITVDELETLVPSSVGLKCANIPGAPEKDPEEVPPARPASSKKNPEPEPIAVDKPNQKMIEQPSESHPCGVVEPPSDAGLLTVGSKVRLIQDGPSPSLKKRRVLHSQSGISRPKIGSDPERSQVSAVMGQSNHDLNQVWVIRAEHHTCQPDNHVLTNQEGFSLQNLASGCFLSWNVNYPFPQQRNRRRDHGQYEVSCFSEQTTSSTFVAGLTGSSYKDLPSELLHIGDTYKYHLRDPNSDLALTESVVSRRERVAAVAPVNSAKQQTRVKWSFHPVGSL